MSEQEKNDMKNEQPEEQSSLTPEEMMNQIEQEADNVSEQPENVENAEPSEGLFDKLGFHKKDKHKKEIKELNEKLAVEQDKYLRLYADFDNFKKRNAKEKIEWMKLAGQEIMTALLPVMDDFGRALKQMEASGESESARKGVELIYQKLRNTLEQRGLKAMETIGKDFNVEEHEALTEVPAPNEEMKGKVLDEVEKGYYLNDKIIRFAKVVVGK